MACTKRPPTWHPSKLFSTDGLSFQHVAALMTGSTQEQYAQMMLEGGRSIEGNRSKSEQPGDGKREHGGG